MKPRLRALFSFALIAVAFGLGRRLRPPEAPALPRRPAPERRVPAPKLDAARAARATLHAEGDKPRNPAAFAAMLQALLTWADTDPEAALAYARTHFTLELRNAALSKLLAAWADRDPRAAWAWTTTQLPDDFAHYDAVLGEVGRSHPDLAWSFATGLAAQKAEFAQTIYVSALRGLLDAGNFAEAAALAESTPLPAGQHAFDLASFVAGEWSRYAPKDAAAWVLSLPDAQGLVRQQALVSLGVTWAESDPRAAADFGAGLPPGTARQEMLATALKTWANTDPSAVSSWLIQRDQDPGLDLVVQQVATAPKLVASDVNLAIGWADTITNDNVRLQSLEQIVGQWLVREPVAARSYLQASTDLSPATLSSMRAYFHVPSRP